MADTTQGSEWWDKMIARAREELDQRDYDGVMRTLLPIAESPDDQVPASAKTAAFVLFGLTAMRKGLVHYAWAAVQQARTYAKRCDCEDVRRQVEELDDAVTLLLAQRRGGRGTD